MNTSDQEEMLKRLTEAKIIMSKKEETEYINAPDILPTETADVPVGYKRCNGKCCNGLIKKLYLFNRSSSSANRCTGTCKECQKNSAKKSYSKTKKNRNYKEYYEEHKEEKRAASRKAYANNKDTMNEKHKKYRQSSAGKKAMKRAHIKRKTLLAMNKGIPYTREMVIDCAKQGGEHPICCLCGEVITEPRNIQIEHLVPVTLGGLDCFTNVGAAHTLCNLRKTKDARELTVEQVESNIKRTELYIEEHPDKFPELFNNDADTTGTPSKEEEET